MAGVHFLMETAGIVDQIVNTTALSFVLCFDELITERFATRASRHIMANIQHRELFDDSSLKLMTDKEVMSNYAAHEMTWLGRRMFRLLPVRLFIAVSLMFLF